MTAAELEELDNLLDDLRTRGEEIPAVGVLRWLHDGRDLQPPPPSPPAEYLPMLLGDGAELEVAEGEPLPLLPAFADAAQQARFLELWDRRWNEIVTQLDTDVKTLDDERTFQPEAMDMRGAVASLPEAERAEMEGQEIPILRPGVGPGLHVRCGKLARRLGRPARQREAAQWLDDALDSIVALTEDDTGKPEVCMYNEDGPPSTSQARVEAFGEAIWAVYDLRQLWKSMGPRVETLRKAPEPGRNDPCHCGSGKKYKKCHGHNLWYYIF